MHFWHVKCSAQTCAALVDAQSTPRDRIAKPTVPRLGRREII